MPIIECKDCKFFYVYTEETERGQEQIYGCMANVFNNPSPIDHCSNAERKDKGDE